MSWSVEEKFLLHIPGKREAPFPFLPQIDPQRLLDVSLKEGMAGFCYRWFRECGFPDHFPEDFKKEFERIYFSVLAKNLLMKKEFDSLLSLFSREGIPVIPIQGFSLLDSLYDDYGLRPLSDMDFLLPSSSINRAMEILSGQGYVSPPNYPLIFIKEDFQVDLHEDILNVSRISGRKKYVDLRFEDLAGRYAEEVPEYRMVYRLKLEANFPLLAAHLVKHSFSRLIWFVDLLRILELRKTKFNPEDMAETAERWNLLPSALIPVLFIKERFHINVPAVLEKRINKAGLQGNFIARLVLNNHRSQGIGNYFTASQIGGVMSKARFIWEFCFPRREVMAQIYPELKERPMKAYFLRATGLISRTLRTIFSR
ncbi:MAG: nucleotidyltransferase family protein [Nitrospinae bacterium]|nr:nucleotidyltransferase family protein [Nitrospinota bacterium]